MPKKEKEPFITTETSGMSISETRIMTVGMHSETVGIPGTTGMLISETRIMTDGMRSETVGIPNATGMLINGILVMTVGKTAITGRTRTTIIQN